MLNKYRSNAVKFLDPITDIFVRYKINPNKISFLSLLFAILSAIFYIRANLILATFFIMLNALFDAIDGEVARKRGLEDKKGDFIDHLIDRYSDIFILTGITFSRFVPLWIGIFVIIGVLLTSYLGTQAQAIGVGRVYSGLMGRADRLILLIISSFALLIYPKQIFGFTILAWSFILLAILSNLTVLQRFFSVWNELK